MSDEGLDRLRRLFTGLAEGRDAPIRFAKFTELEASDINQAVFQAISLASEVVAVRDGKIGVLQPDASEAWFWGKQDHIAESAVQELCGRFAYWRDLCDSLLRGTVPLAWIKTSEGLSAHVRDFLGQLNAAPKYALCRAPMAFSHIWDAMLRIYQAIEGVSGVPEPPGEPQWTNPSAADYMIRVCRREPPTELSLTDVRRAINCVLDWCDAAMAGGGDEDDRDVNGAAVAGLQLPHLQAVSVGKPQDVATSGDDKMIWQDVQEKLEALRLKGERYTSRQELADKIGCTKFLVQKAITNGSVELQEWASRERATPRRNAPPEAVAVAFGGTPQAREPDPADIMEDGDIDAAMAYLLDQAGPDERARINAMNPAERRRLAETVYRDPDREEQACRHRRAAKMRRK